MDGMIAEVAARGQADLDPVSVDSTVSRAHHHAAGMVVDPELLVEDLGKAVAEEAEEKGLFERGKAPRQPHRAKETVRRPARGAAAPVGVVEPGSARPNRAASAVG